MKLVPTKTAKLPKRQPSQPQESTSETFCE